MRRREFITLIGGAAAWPLAARAQQPDRPRRIGVLMNLPPDDLEASARVTALAQGLQQLGWTVGRNLRIDYRWGAVDADHSRTYAAELVALAPELILTAGIPAAVALQRATRTVPIVFVNTVDPVGAGLVDSLAEPGGNVTGFTIYEYGISAKWLELLKEIAPQLRRVAVLRDADISSGIGQLSGNPSSGADVRGGSTAGRCARSRRDRAHRDCIRALLERRSDCGGEHVGSGSSQTDHRTRSSPPNARGLLFTVLRH
jgi:putative ABC transport system substrate-binding protein